MTKYSDSDVEELADAVMGMLAIVLLKGPDAFEDDPVGLSIYRHLFKLQGALLLKYCK